jgi:hypothetical protein
MATDCRIPKISMPVIPSSRTVRERLREVETLAKRLRVLLRVASELEQIDREGLPSANPSGPSQEGGSSC